MRLPCVCLLLALIADAVPARAQPAEALHAGVNFGAASIDGHSEFSLIATVFYRFNPTVALGLEFVRQPMHPPAAENFVTIDFDGREFTTVYTNPTGRSVNFALTMRLEAPPIGRIVPFAILGSGVDRSERKYTATTDQTAGPRPPFEQPYLPLVTTAGQTIVGLQAMAGGGVSVMASRFLLFDLDMRYLYFLEQPDHHVWRLGGGVAYRF
jgi:hypothetical protein